MFSLKHYLYPQSSIVPLTQKKKKGYIYTHIYIYIYENTTNLYMKIGV